MAVTKDAVRQALRAVPSPDGAPSLADSAALSDIAVIGDKVAFAISVPAERAGELEAVRRAAEAAVRSVPGVSEAIVALTSERPTNAVNRAPPAPHQHGPGEHQHGHQHAPAAPQRPASSNTHPEGVKYIVAVASGKGGVGKSTTTANLALALAGEGLKVGILDADVFGPSMPTLFGLTNKRPEVVAKVIQPLRAYGLPIMSMGFLVDPDTAMIWRGPMVMSALTQMLREVAWGTLDVLLIDMPPGTGDAQLTIAQQARVSGAVIVSTPQDLALIDARRAIAMFEKVNVPILGLIENMSYFCCPACGTRANIFGHGGARTEAEKRGVRFLGEIPLDGRIRELSDAGTPFVAIDESAPEADAYRAAARSIMAALEGQPMRAAPRIVIEA